MVENVTAPSAGVFPDPDGEVRLRMRLPFRTTSTDPRDGLAAYLTARFPIMTLPQLPALSLSSLRR
ncbi:MAG: hypothetical protein ACOX52_15895 [Verrucomicrobiota bacterium]